VAFSSGTFTLNEPDVVTGTTISSSWANSVLGDIATNGLTVCITKNGQSTVTANIPFAGFRLTNIGAPTTASDALREGSAIGAVSAAAITGTAVSGTSFVAGGTSLTAFAAATVQLTIGGTGATSVFAIPGTLEATGTTGALTVAGGVYVAKASNLTGAVTMSAALTYGGVTLSNAVTGTGNMVLATSPTFTTSVLSSATTIAVFNTTATTVNAFGAASVALNIGHASGTNTVLGATTFSQAVTATAAGINVPTSALGTAHSGTYTPTVSATSNVAASGVNLNNYCRIGNFVQVSGYMTVDVTSAGATSFEIDLPVASNLANAFELSGSGAGQTSSEGIAIYGSAANNTAVFQYTSVGTANQGVTYTFGYRVI